MCRDIEVSETQLWKMGHEKDVHTVRHRKQTFMPIVVLMNTGGKMRVCFDPRELNEAILREHYPLRNLVKMSANM